MWPLLVSVRSPEDEGRHNFGIVHIARETASNAFTHTPNLCIAYTDTPSLAAISRRSEQAKIHTHILFPSIDRSAAAVVCCLLVCLYASTLFHSSPPVRVCLS